MEVRKAKLEEGNLLSEIAMRSKAYWGYDREFIEACRDALTISENYILSNHVYVMEEDSSIAGFFSLITNGETGVLDALFMDPKFIGQGYGRLLWNSILEKSREIGLHEFTIDSDPHAEEFYRKMGAIRIGEVESTVFKGRQLPLMKVVFE